MLMLLFHVNVKNRLIVVELQVTCCRLIPVRNFFLNYKLSQIEGRN